MSNNFIDITPDNIEQEHICCALSSLSTLEGVKAKKTWLKDRIGEGLIFKKLDARGKVFIEYIPAEKAWMPIEAKGYMLINCFWVAGSYKGNGHGKALLAACENDAKGRGLKGVAIVVGSKKKPFLSDKKFMVQHGYELEDSCKPYFELLAKRFDGKDKTIVRFRESAHQGMGVGIKGIDIFYTVQCPFTTPYTESLNPIILASNYPIRLHQIATRQMAQEHLCPITTYSVFVDGEFYTQEILTPDKLNKLIEKLS